MKRATRKRTSIQFGRSAKEHRNEAVLLYQYALDAHQRAKESQTCPEVLSSLCQAKQWAAKAQQHSLDVGASTGRSRGRVNFVIDKLRSQLETDFAGAMRNCVRKYPEG
jgi:hypothetical protein